MWRPSWSVGVAEGRVPKVEAGQRLREETMRAELGWGEGLGKNAGLGVSFEPAWIIHWLWAATSREGKNGADCSWAG